MGCSGSKEDDKSTEAKPNYIAMALLSANNPTLMMGYQNNPNQLDEDMVDQLVRKAKNDGQTVSVVNGCLYMDYKFIGFMPSSMG